ncbi:MAG: acyltransferase [Thaumarchaeota archaeon]|nr:acyltransferase [Nitrososphaerota archaeon]
MAENKPHGEVPGLTGMRGLAALYVMLGHYLFSPTLHAVPWYVSMFTQLGWSGVDFFFVLSGYLLASIYVKPTRQYFVRRVFRTFPLYYATLPLYYLIGLKLSPLDLIYAEDYFLNNGPYFPQWTLMVEELFYFVIFPLILVFRPKPTYLVAVGLAALALWYLLPVGGVLADPNGQMPPHFICYAVGIYLAKNRAKILARVRATRLLALGCAGAFLLSDAALYFSGLSVQGVSPVQQILFSSVYGSVILFMQNNRLFTNRVAHFLGKISYGVYLFQVPFLVILGYPQQLLYFGPQLEALHLTIFEAAPLAAAATFVAAVASFYLFEGPLISLGRRLTQTSTHPHSGSAFARSD